MTAASDARAAVLSAIGGPGTNSGTGSGAGLTEISREYASLPREYRRKGSLDPAACLDLLEHRLREYEAGVYRSSAEELPQRIAQVLAGRGKSRLAIPGGLPAVWLPSSGFSFAVADDLPAYELDAMDGVVSGCAAAIAATGTLVLQNAPAQGRRKLSLVPDYHLCIVYARQVVETVPEGFDRFAQTTTLPTTFISGPSATADIEMTRVKGVHGPRSLDVILVP